MMTLPGAPPWPESRAKEIADALSRRGPIAARTRHAGPTGEPRYTNRLILETSPYLLQHAHNPVNWYPWGDEAFADAARLGRPILLSVGYSTCHWCHVMEHESFEDEEIAGYLNAHFIPIKVDREERPDVDGIYMSAVQLMTGGGGWPMTVALTADRRPFFGGTYFPPRDGARGARLGFLSVLVRLFEVFTQEPATIEANAEQLSRAMRHAAQPEPAREVPGSDTITAAVEALAARFDAVHGGFGHAPKFPRPATFDLLLRYWRRTGDPDALHIVTHSLDQMSRGGVYDQIAGGFHRYSVDEEWLVPHFEKMLYDNAQLVTTLLDAHLASKSEPLRATAEETLEYVAREMTSPEGAFFSATDADSEGHEGRFFVWTPSELDAALGSERARVARAYYAVSPHGNFEGRSILHRPRTDEMVAAELDRSVPAVRAEIEQIKTILRQARSLREPPLLDDKVITEWNGQMISAFVRGAEVSGRRDFAERALEAARFVLDRLRDGERLARAFRAGAAKHHAVLEDYAFLIAGLLDLFGLTSDPRWLREAIALQAIQDADFKDEASGGYFTSPAHAAGLLFREKPSYDGAQPSGNSVAALNLLRLAELTEVETHRRSAEALFGALAQSLDRGALAAPKLACALSDFFDHPKEVVIVRSASGTAEPLLGVVRRTLLPNRALVVLGETPERDAELAALVPWCRDKRAIDGRATAYVCVRGVCDRPTTDPGQLETQLVNQKPYEARSAQLRIPRG